MPDVAPQLPDANHEGDILSAGVNQPDLDAKTLKVGTPAISGPIQAHTVWKSLMDANNQRNLTNAEIVSRYNRKQPREAALLEQDGATWKSNFSTGFLFGVVNRAIPAFTQYVEGMRFLTQAKLKDETDQGLAKTEFYREKFTGVVRSWKGFRSYISSLAKELVIIGYAASAHTDEYEWRPRFYRGDKIALAEGSSEFPDYLQIFAISQDILIHEMVEIIKNREAAKAAKWDIDNAVEAINDAMPVTNTDNDKLGGNARNYEEAIIEGNLGKSHETGVKVIRLAHLFAIEPDTSEVTHIITDANGGHKELLWSENRFSSMAEVISMFTLDPPDDGKYYGSVGLARILANIAHAMDVATMDAIDSLRLAGILIMKNDTGKGLPNPIVKSPFMYVNSEALFEQKPSFQQNVSSFVELINKLAELAEIAAQQYIPNTLTDNQSGEKPTATQVNVDRSRELQSHSATIARFAGQFANSMYPFQTRLGNPETNDEEAEQFQKNLKEFGFTDEEIKEISHSSPSDELQDLTEQDRAIKSAIAKNPAYVGNPMIDQKKLLEMGVNADLGPEIAGQLILPDAMDPNVESEGIQKQIGENVNILNGYSVPVSPRDADEVHLKMLLPDLTKGVQAAAQNPMAIMSDPKHLDNLNAGIVHGDGHITNMQKKGMKPEQIQPYANHLKGLTDGLHKIGEGLAKQKAAMMMQAQQAQGAPPQPGDPAQGGGDPSQPSQPPGPQPQQLPSGRSMTMGKPVDPGDLARIYQYAPADVQREIEAALGLEPSGLAGTKFDPNAPESQIPATAPTLPVPPNLPVPPPAPPQAPPQLPPPPDPTAAVPPPPMGQ